MTTPAATPTTPAATPTTPAATPTTPAATPTTPAAALASTTTEFREPLATDFGRTTIRSGIAERQGFPGADDSQEGEGSSSQVGVIAGSLAGLLALVLLALGIFFLVRYGCCFWCCCCAAAAGDDKKEPVSDQAYDNEVYQDLASCVSMGVKPPLYDNLVTANTDEKVADVDNRANHNLYSGGAIYDNSVADNAVNAQHVYEDVK